MIHFPKPIENIFLGDDFKEESLDILLDIIKEFKRKNFYLSDFTKDLTTTLGIFKLASENNYNQIMEVAKHIIELEKSFRKNTRKINFRAPDVWFLKYYMLKEFRVLEGEKEKVNESRYDEFIKWLLSEKRSGKKDDK